MCLLTQRMARRLAVVRRRCAVVGGDDACQPSCLLESALRASERTMQPAAF